MEFSVPTRARCLLSCHQHLCGEAGCISFTSPSGVGPPEPSLPRLRAHLPQLLSSSGTVVPSSPPWPSAGLLPGCPCLSSPGGPSVCACIIHCTTTGMCTYRRLAVWGGTGSTFSWHDWSTSPPEALTLLLMNCSSLFTGKEEVHPIQ